MNTSLNPQIGAATDACGTTNVQIYGFAFNVTSGTAVFTAINNFVTSGTYVSADILNYKLYQTNFSVFNTGNLLATIPASGPGTHTFSGFSFSMTAVTRYFWITVDLAPAAINNHTVICNIITAAMPAITGALTFGTNTVGGTQTISCSAFPIELVSFTGNESGSANTLQWITATETNNEYFTVERSIDGNLFEPIAKVNGAGNSFVTLYYHVSDDMPYEGINYYRLKQTDFDGHYKYSDLIAVENSYARQLGLFLFPDPVQDRLNVKITSGEENLIIEMTDITGRSVLKKNIDSVNENGITIFDVSGFSPGIYFVNIGRGNKKIHKKFIKQ